MRTLASQLGAHAVRQSERPRVYADANVPAGVVAFMRQRLRWDVLFVIEEDDLRRAPDIEHYRLACRLRRTLITLDRDYLDDRRFPPAEGAGVIVMSAPHEHLLTRLLRRLDRSVFARSASGDGSGRLPLEGQKLNAPADWMLRR